VNATLLQQLNQHLCLVAQAMAQAGAALLGTVSLPRSLAADLQSQPVLPKLHAQPSPLFALPLHHLGACVHFNIRGETPQQDFTT